MSGQRFSPGQVFKWQEELYEVRQLLAGDQINIVKLRTGATQAVTAVQLVQALLAGELQFVTRTVLDPLPAPVEPMTLADYTDVQRAVAEYRLEIIRPFLALPPHERRQAIKARVKELRRQRHTNSRTLDTAISIASIYRWIKAYTDSQGDPRALVPQTTQRGGQHTTRLQADTEAIVKATIDDHYYVREHRTIDYMHREVAVRVEAENQRRQSAEQLELPSRATLARRLGNLEVQAILEAKQGHRLSDHSPGAR